MDKQKLIQKHLFKTEKFTIKENGLEQYLKDYEGVFTRFYPFDDFSRRTNHTFTEAKKRFLTIGVIMLLAVPILVKAILLFENDNNTTIALLTGSIIAVLGLFFIAYFFLSQKQNLLLDLDNEEQVFIVVNKPNRKEVEEFIDTFYKKRKEYYREKYFYIDFKGKREEEIGKVKWLKDEDIISKSEYDEAVSKINNAWD